MRTSARDKRRRHWEGDKIENVVIRSKDKTPPERILEDGCPIELLSKERSKRLPLDQKASLDKNSRLILIDMIMIYPIK